MNTGCFKCDKAQWDADGCTCEITGLLVGNTARGCEYRMKFGTGGLKMTLDEAIKICEEDAEKIGGNPQSDRHAERCRQLADWLTELKQWRRVYGICPSYEMCIPECKEGYNAQIAEYKRLLKMAVEDFDEIHSYLSEPYSHICEKRWRYADEALKLIES